MLTHTHHTDTQMSTHTLAGRVKGCPFWGSRECSGSRFDCSVLGVRALQARVSVETPSSKKCAGVGQQDPSSCCAGFLHDREATAPVLGCSRPTRHPGSGWSGWPPGTASPGSTHRNDKCLWPRLLAGSVCPQAAVLAATEYDVCRHPALKAHTENSGPPFLVLICSRLNRKPTKGFIQRREGGPPKTDFIPSHRSLRSHVGFSLFSLSISWEQKKPEEQ